MSQTTEGLSFREAKVEFYDSSAGSWTDISSHGASIAVSGGERATGTQHTFDGDVPILKAGKRGTLEITCRYVYTEEAAGPFEALRTNYELPGGAMQIRYTPTGSGFMFSSGSDGICKNFKYPEGEAGDGVVVMGEFVVETPQITKS